MSGALPQRAPDPARLRVGARLGTYEIIAPLGAGGMGEVFRARDTKLGREVALKVLPAEVAGDPQQLARFEREARLLAALNHPSIAQVYGFECAIPSDGSLVHFLAMELVPGEDLTERLKHGPIPVDEAIAIARQVAEALEEAHEKGIVHRDLKPANVKVTPEGKVKVLDFGLAKAWTGEATTGTSSPDLSQSPTLAHSGTAAGLILGTAAYMSPEQARGKAVDKRADIWAFGVLLWEMLTGRKLFAGETVTDVLASVVREPIGWEALPAAAPASLRDLLRRCLDRDSRNRLRDIGEARVAFDRVRGEGRDDAAVAPRRPLAWLPVLGVAVLACLLTAGAFHLLAPGRPAPALRKVDLVAPDLDVDWNVGPGLSPDGSRVAYSARNRVWVRDLDQLEARPVAEVSAPTPLGWSPDSQAVAFGDVKKLWTVAAQGGARVAVADIPGTGQLLGATWSRAGQIAFAVWRGGIYQVPARGGAPGLLLEADPDRRIDFHYPSWLPNGDLLYLVHWKDRASQGESPLLAVYDGRKEIPVAIDVGATESWPTLTPEGFLLYVRPGDNAGIWAVPYDVRGRRGSGQAFRVAPAGFSVSASAEGSLLFVQQPSADVVCEMTWVDRSGKTIGAVGPGRVGLSQPTLSPDGRRIAFAAGPWRNQDIWVHDLERGTETRLSFGGKDAEVPAWLSPTRVAYVLVTSSGLKRRILAVKADGSGEAQEIVSETALGAKEALALAPDGRTVLQVVDERGHGRLRVGELQADGRIGPLRPLLRIDPEPDVGEARVSPDGRLLAYVTDNPGQPELFLTRFPSGEGRWQVTTEAARNPRWARATGELFFTTGLRDDAIFSAKVDPSQDPPVAAPAVLFRFDAADLSSGMSGDQYDVAADGRRLLVVRRGAGAAARRMVLVQNWLAEFQRPGGR